jgi:hypothetical protein
MEQKIWDVPSEVSAEEGNVVVDGPDGVAVTMTPEAAIETSERLLSTGTEAQGQRVEKGWQARQRGAPVVDRERE